MADSLEYEVLPADLPAEARARMTSGMALATVVATDERHAGRGFAIRYVFEGVGVGGFQTLVVHLHPDRPEFPSVAAFMPSALWHEREARDLFGVTPVGHPDPRPLVLHDGWPPGLFPMRKDFDRNQRVPVLPAPEFPHVVVEGEGVFEVPVGPIHAGIIEPGHFRFSSVGETVLLLDARLFYTHRGLEKSMEGRTASEAFLVAERICGVCSVSHGLGFAEAVEQVAGVTAPPRARIIRSVALELERLYNHVGDIGNLCAGVGYHYGTSAGLRLKEGLQRLGERVAGNRFLRGIITPGGVARDLDASRVADIRAVLRVTATDLDDLLVRLEANPSVVDRLDDTGRLERRVAVDLGVTGVAARASGVARDARLEHPVAAYPETAPEIVTAEEGDVHARLNVRVGEVRVTLQLVEVLLARLEPGALTTPISERLPPGRVGIASIESPRGAAVHWLRSDDLGLVDRYHLRSASYANWPAVPIAAQSAIIPDFPLVNKSFELCYSCTDR